MDKNDGIFTEVARRVTSRVIFNEILQKQQNAYDIQPHKIENTQGQTMLKIYISLNSRHNYSSQSEFDDNNWNQNQRRVFVWFIICYTYFLQIDKKQFSDQIYDQLSAVFFGKKPQFLHFQHLNLLKSKHRISWTPQEDQLLSRCTNDLSPGKWNQISKRIFYNSNRTIFRTSKHCRERWLNHLDKNKKHGQWTSKEDLIIFEYVLSNGKRWSKIVSLLNETRTEHMIKNRYNSLISKSKGGKKIKEEEVAKKILNLLSQAVQSQSNSQNMRQLSQSMRIQGQNNPILSGQNNGTLDSLNNNANAANPPPIAFSNPLPISCFLDYNCFYFPQIIFNENRFGLYQMENRQSPIMQLSKKSSFSLYQPKVNY